MNYMVHNIGYTLTDDLIVGYQEKNITELSS